MTREEARKEYIEKEREKALPFITETINEFQEFVMQPLHRNIHLYDIRKNKYVEIMYLMYGGFSDNVKNTDEISAFILELNDFQMSQLLSLCKDISELYNLPVYDKMPKTIPQDNPIKYVDPNETMPDRPDLKNYRNPKELIFAREVLGELGEEAYKKTKIESLNFPGQEEHGFSPPVLGTLFLGKNFFKDPMSEPEGRDLFIHELFHQVQYMREPISASSNLIREVTMKYPYYYDKDNMEKYMDLKDFPHYESQAQMVGEFAEYYYSIRYNNYDDSNYIELLKNMARIMETSGFISEATAWIKANL